MNLAQLRQEVMDHGFDPIVYGTRATQYLNDAMNLVARRVDYYIEDAVQAFSTVAGTATYAWPANFARMRSLLDTVRSRELEAVTVREIDRSAVTTGVPAYYAVYGSSVALYPTPDAAYSLQLRYWAMPSALVGDTDTPTLPADWHHLLWVYAVWMCYEADDDSQMGQYWQQRFNTELSQFTADQKFPNTDRPTQAAGMWDRGTALNTGNLWTFYQ